MSMNSTAPTRISTAVTLAAALLLAASGTAQAQQEVPETGGRVYGLVGGALGDGRFVATGAGAGLRVTRHLGLDVELMHLSGRNGAGAGTPWSGGLSVFSTSATAGAADDYPPLGGGGGLFPSIRFEHHERDVTTFLTKFTVEFPIADDLLFPYLTGGGGLGRVTERASVVIDPISGIPIPGISWEDNQTELGLALVLGGGVDVRLWWGFGVGVDIRWLRVLRRYDALDTAQVAGRASYRF